MVYLLSVYAIGLFFAAWRSRTRGYRTLFLILALANVGTAIKMVHDGYPYAFRTEPQRTAPGIQDDTRPWLPRR